MYELNEKELKKELDAAGELTDIIANYYYGYSERPLINLVDKIDCDREDFHPKKSNKSLGLYFEYL